MYSAPTIELLGDATSVIRAEKDTKLGEINHPEMPVFEE
jgi:hypothetical protein